MSDRRVSVLTAFIGLLLVGVIATGSFVGSSAVADSLAPNVDRAVTAAGLEDVDVDVTGREVTVRGGTVDELAEAVRASEAITGVRSATVDDRPGSVDVIDMTRPYLKVRRDTDRLRILGAVPSAGTAATIKATAARAFGVPVRGDLTIDRTLPPAAWADQLPDAFDDLVQISDLVVTVDGDVLEVSGSMGTATERRRVLARVADAVPSLTVASDVGLTKVAP